MRESTVQATSVGDLFAEKMQTGTRRGTIHSVFSAAVNFQLDDQLFTLGSPRIGKGPSNIIVSELARPLDQFGLEPEQLVQLRGTELQLSQWLKVELSCGEVWPSDWHCSSKLMDTTHLPPRLAKARSFLLREGNLEGAAQLFIHPLPQTLLVEAILPGVLLMEYGVISRSEVFWIGVGEVLGVGPGLTPAGDDLLVGFFLMSHCLERLGLGQLPPGDRSALAGWIQEQTNQISAMGIHLALAGRPQEVVRDVIDSLFDGSDPQLLLHLLRLIDRGSTSGSDLITGIILAGEILLGQSLSIDTCCTAKEVEKQ